MFLVTANRPAKSDAALAECLVEEFDDWVKAHACAESWLRDRLVAVKVWELKAAPTLKQVVDWETKDVG